MRRAGGIAQCALGVRAVAAYRAERRFHIARVVHGVEDAEHVHAVFHRAFNKTLHHIIGIVTITEQVLAAQQHLQGGLRHGFFQLAQANPRVLAEKTNTGVKGRAAPALQRPVAHLIKRSSNGQHIIKTQAGGEQRLVSVAQDDIGNGNSHGSLRELSVKAVMVNGGGNHRL